MSATYPMTDHHSPEWIGAALGTLGTVVVGVLGFLGVRATAKGPKEDPQAIQNEGWDDLLTQMRLELKAASRERNALWEELKKERKEREADRAAWRLEREALTGEIRQLRAVAEGFERLLRRYGFDLPDRKTLADPARTVEVTLRQPAIDDDDK